MVKYFLILSLTISVYANMNILYWNFDTNSEFNKGSIDFEFMKETFNSNKFDLIILNNLVSPNLPPRFVIPYHRFSTGDTFFSKEKNFYGALLRSHSSSESLIIKKYFYIDKTGVFFKNSIKGFIINNTKAIVILNFDEKDEALHNLNNLNYVVNDLIERIKIDRKNILFVGNLNLDKEFINKKLVNFRSILQDNGSKIEFVRERGFTGYKLVKHDLFFSANESAKASPYIDFKETLLEGKYKGSENTSLYIKNVSNHLPILIEF